ncbi:MAG: ribulose-phosphate 3-epimerase [Desulfurococcaceae archaeon]
MSDKKSIILSGSILNIPFYEIPEKIRIAKEHGLSLIHLDIMDGVFVPQLSFGLSFAIQLREIIDLDLEAHLMVVNPEKFIAEIPDKLFTRVFFHYESTLYPLRLIEKIKNKGMMAGVAINPSTPVQNIETILGEVDAVLVMLVEPGYGGQVMKHQMLKKIEQLNKLRRENGYSFIIACDGGIKIDNARIIVEKGADELIVGTGLFNSPRFPGIIRDFLSINLPR